jgi:tight adherence protein C
MSALAVTIVTLLLLAMAAFAAYGALFGSQHAIEERITDMAVKMRVAYGPEADMGLSEASRARSLFRWVAKRLPEPRADTPQGEKLGHTLVQAGFLRSGALRNFQLIRITSAGAGAILGIAIPLAIGAHGARPIGGLVLGAAIGAFVPSYYVARKAKRRRQAIAAQLSDVLDLLVVCVEAGLGLSEAIKTVGTEAERQQQEIGGELSMVSGELTAGLSLGQALRNFADRTAVEDIKPLAATLIQSEQLGAQIGPALRSISDSLRTARRLRAEEAAQKTTVKILFPLVLFILPAMMGVIVGPAMIQIMHVLGGAK